MHEKQLMTRHFREVSILPIEKESASFKRNPFRSPEQVHRCAKRKRLIIDTFASLDCFRAHTLAFAAKKKKAICERFDLNFYADFGTLNHCSPGSTSFS